MPRKDEKHPLIGQVLGDRYRIEALLGEGGMGAVFRARHLSLDRAVAVKVLKPSLSDDEQVAKRFDREALAVSKLDHPNCVQVIDFGTTPKGMKYLVMQYLEGKELRELTGVSLPVEQAVSIGVQVLRALEHAHKRGLVHRDLKPENIFLVRDDDGQDMVKLVDFGIVKLLEGAGQEKLTRMGMAFGTPTYMSPEQAAGGTIDERTDLYAVGVLLYEMLTGAPPFDADEPGILLRMHILADPPPLPDTIPAPVAQVVSRLLAKEPGERYADAHEARCALAASLGAGAEESAVGAVAAMGAAGTASAAASGARPPDVATEPKPAPTAAERLAEAATESLAVVDTRAEPMSGAPEPVVPVRSGGTVLADGSTSPGAPAPMASSPVPPAAASRVASPLPGAPLPGTPLPGAPLPGAPLLGAPMTATPMPGAPMSPASAVPMAPVAGPGASMSQAGMSGASMSHGSAPGSVSSGALPFDPLAVSNANLPRTAPHVSGAYGIHSGAYGVVPGSARRRSRSN